MKFLLTSSGLMNKSLVKELLRLAGKPARVLKFAFIPTAANVEEGDKGWLVKDYNLIQALKPAQLDIVDISALPIRIWEKRLREANVLVFGGGNTFHLMAWMRKSGLHTLLPKLLKTRVYVGISAGSIAINPTLKFSDAEKLENVEPVTFSNKGLGFVNFGVRPHINSPYFPKWSFQFMKNFSKKVKHPVYAIDDQTGISVDGKRVKVVSEGMWKRFN